MLDQEKYLSTKKFTDLGSVTYMFTGKCYIVTLKAYVWFLNGKIHNDDSPAMIYDDGAIKWYSNGVLHRIGGPAFVSKSDIIHHYVIQGAFYSPQEYFEHPLVRTFFTKKLLEIFAD